jgi:hypothetical protein
MEQRKFINPIPDSTIKVAWLNLSDVLYLILSNEISLWFIGYIFSTKEKIKMRCHCIKPHHPHF